MNQFLPTTARSATLRIALLKLFDTGTYEQQWRRPYESVVNEHSIGALQERISDPQRVINAGTLAGITNGILQPQLQPERPIHIVNGWNEHRFRWLAVVENTDRFGVRVLEMVQGYTDQRGISMNGALNPDMTFYINNVLTLRHSNLPTPTGNRDTFNIVDSCQLLAKHDFDGIHSGGVMDYRLKPTDIYAAMDRADIAQEMQSQNIVDTRSTMTGRPVMSRRQNTIASGFVSTLLETYKNASMTSYYGQTEDTVLDYARDAVEEATASSSAFVRALSGIRGGLAQQFFTWRDLCTLDSNVQRDEVTSVALQGTPRAVENTSFNIAGRSADWGSSQQIRNPQFAQILAQAVPALMMSYGFARIHVVSTNRTSDGRMRTEVANWNDFPQIAGYSVDMSGPILTFMKRLETEVLVDMSQNGQADFAISVAADLLGETIIRIEYNGGSMEQYVVPSFADSLLTPLVTNDSMRSTDVALDFQKIFRDALPTYGEDSHRARTDNNDQQFISAGSGGWNLA